MKKSFEEGQFVRVDGTGFVNGVTVQSKVATVVDFNEDAVQVSFFNGDEDWFKVEQVDGGKNDQSDVGCESKPFFNGFTVIGGK